MTQSLTGMVIHSRRNHTISTAALMAGLYPVQSEPNNIFYMMDPLHVRDQLLRELEEGKDKDKDKNKDKGPFVDLLRRHLIRMPVAALDSYSNIEFHLVNYGARVRVITYAPPNDLLVRIRIP